MKIIKKSFLSILIFLLLFSKVSFVLAIDEPTPPSPPSAPVAPSSPTPPPPSSVPAAPEPENISEPTNAPKQKREETGSNQPQKNESKTEENKPTSTPSPTLSNSSTQTATPTPAHNEKTSGRQESNGQSGAGVVTTGDATSSSMAITTGNQNASLSPIDSGGSTVVQNGNGANSVNNGTIVDSNATFRLQNNKAIIDNSMDSSSVSGKNQANENMAGGNITTGDANTTGTLVTAVNTNVDGVQVSEFNIVDDQRGDVLLDFGKGCIWGCVAETSVVKNTGNGANSQNTSLLGSSKNNVTFQTNDIEANNGLTLAADSGNNQTSRNVGGDTTITTGDANVSANALNFVNNNISGNVAYSVVNVFGNLAGDIIMPESAFQGCCGTSSAVASLGNGANSTNTGTIAQNSKDTTTQTNTADIQNNIAVDAETGKNQADKNTGGEAIIASGDANVEARTVNVANNNIDGGNWWLVVVNEAGRWIGKIVGAPSGQNVAGSEGFDIAVNEKGDITATNSGNGANSENNTAVVSNTENTTVQDNNAKVVNNLNLSANTGKNEAAKNTGGNTNIQTGDANVIANIVNFVNNNITGGGKLMVTVVNVFGSWMGDFVGPGQTKENKTAHASGGVAVHPQTIYVTPTPTNTSEHIVEYINQTKKGSRVLGSQTTNSKPLSRPSRESSRLEEEPKELEEEEIPVSEARVESATLDQNTININLAWLLPLLPLFVGFTIARRRSPLK